MLLVHDANVLIDLQEGALLEALFEASWRVGTVDALFEQELRPSYPALPRMGLELLGVRGEWIARSVSWASQYRRTSAMDRLCLALALQENCPLITGDARLREAAQAESCTVHGTIWLVEQLVAEGATSAREALAAYEAMQNAGSRLPFNVARRRLGAEK